MIGMRVTRASVRSLLVAAAVTAVLPLVSADAAPPLPEMTIPVCRQPPALDGALDDTCWKAATVLRDFYIVGTDKRTDRCAAHVARDKEWLYIAFDVAHPNPKSIAPKITQRDGQYIYREDCVKVAFDPGTEGVLWYHFRLSAGNVQGDMRRSVGRRQYERDWDLPWRSATRITDKGWQAEIAMPLGELVAGGDVRKARINLLVYSNNIPVVRADGKPTRAKRREGASWAWTPSTRWWDAPERFGRVKGLDGVAFDALFLPYLEEVKVSGYAMEDGGCVYKVHANVVPRGSRGGEARLTVVDTPASGRGREVVHTVRIKGVRRQPVEVTMPVQSPGKRAVLVRLRNEGTGQLLEEAVVRDTSVLEPLGAWLDRDYYTSEKQAVAVCHIGLPAPQVQGNTLIAKDKAGKTLGQSAASAGAVELPIALSDLAPGRHAITVEHRKAAGGVLSSLKLELIKRAPKPGHEWKIDRVNRVLLHNGEPFFPFAAIAYFRWIKDMAPYFEDLRKIGVNSILHWSRINAKDAPAYLELAARNNLMVTMKLENFMAGRSLSTQRRDPAIRKAGGPRENGLAFVAALRKAMPSLMEGLGAVKDHPNVMGYFIFDEPTPEWDQYLAGQILYDRIREVDGYKPMWQCWAIQHPEGAEWTSWSDILCRDIYWAPPRHAVMNLWSPGRLAKHTALTDRRAEAERKPTWIVPCAEWYSAMRQRAFTADEQMCQSYLAMIHGAKGLCYFAYPFTYQSTWDVLRRLAGQVKTLAPALLAPKVPQTVSYEPGAFLPEKNIMPDVHAALFRYPGGGYVLLCANWRDYPVDTNISVSVLAGLGKVERLFETGEYRAQNRSFSDRFEPLAVRAYAFEGAAPGDEPVQVSVRMKAHADEGLKEPALVQTMGRPGKKNIMTNPSFEDVTVPGAPDYWKLVGSTGLTKRIGSPGCPYQVNADNPFHGKVVMKIIAGPDGMRHMQAQMQPQHPQPTAYTLSACMRAEREGMQGRLMASGVRRAGRWEGGVSKSFTLTTDWKRYSIKVIIPSQFFPRYNFTVAVPRQKAGAVWVDAVQLEQGEETTEFQP